MPVPRSPFRRDGLARRLAPFVGAAAVAFALVPLPPAQRSPGELALAAAIASLLLLAIVALPWERLPRSLDVVPPLAFLTVIELLRDGLGGAASGYTPLLLVPTVWLALYGTREQFVMLLVAMAALLIAPIVLIGPPAYSVSDARRMLLWLVMSPLVGFTVLGLRSEVESLLARLEVQARTDALTGLANRRALDDDLARELSRAERHAEPLAVALIDLDSFKTFNDARGHQDGDLLLKEAAAAWRASLREVDLLGRYGGDEFVAVLPGCDAEEAALVLERALAATPRGQTGSAGVAGWDGVETRAELVRRADRALYDAKAAGRRRVTVG